MSGSTRFGFRTRLTALILAVFLGAGAALVGAQNLLAKRAVDQVVISWESLALTDDPQSLLPTEGDEVYVTHSQPTTAAEIDTVTGEITPLTEGELETFATDTSAEAMDALTKWSLVVLAVFAVVAAVLANWLAGRSTNRMAQIARAANGIDAANRHERLRIGGPHDEVRELGDTVDGMLDRLDDAMTRQERFVSAASHELRTPLATARASLEIPLVQDRFDDDVRPDVERALAATERSEQLIAALLTLAKAQGATVGTVSPDQAVRAAADAAGATGIDYRGPRSDIEPDTKPDGAPDTTGQLLEIAVENLARNALTHNVPDGFARLAAAAPDGDAPWSIVVENDGPTVPRDAIEQLKEPFNRGDRTRLAGDGLGLGLAIVDTIARALDLELELEPRDEGGLRAELSPRAPSSIKEVS